MIIWVVSKNGEVVEGRIHATPDQAFDFFVEKFIKEYPHAKIAQAKDELKNEMKENNGFSVQAEEDLWSAANTFGQARKAMTKKFFSFFVGTTYKSS